MKVLVQNSETGDYFLGGAAWGPDIRNAVNFERRIRACKFCRENGLRHVQIVLQFKTKVPDVILPLQPGNHMSR